MNRVSRTTVGVMIAVAALALVAVACGGATPAAPAATSAPVVQTVVVQQTVAVPQTVVVAATPAPTTGPTATSAPQAVKGGTASIAFFEEPDALVPAYTSMSFSIYADEICCTGLWNWDDSEKPEPELAAQIPTTDNGGVSADGKTITVKLRDGLKWQDGQPLTSDDIKFTISVYQNPKNSVVSRNGFDKSGGGAYITGVDTPDPLTAVIHYNDVYAPWMASLGLSSNGGMGLLPAHLLKDKPSLDKDPFLLQPVGAGPFQVTENVSGDHITMKANPNYWRGKPNLDSITIKIVPSSEAGFAAVQTGDINIVEDLAESDIPTVQGLAPKVKLVSKPGQEFEHLLFNLDPKNGPAFFQDVNVRKAIIMSIDRDTIVKTLLNGLTTVPATLWPNSDYADPSLKPYPYDVKQAQALLEGAGWKKGDDGIYAKSINGKNTRLSFSYMTTSGNKLRADQQVLITSMLKKAGIEMTTQNLPSTTFFGSFAENGPMATSNFQMAGYTTGFYPDPDPSDNFLCEGIPTKDNPSGGNWYHICDKALADLFKQEASTADTAKRKQLFFQAEKIQYDNVYFIPLYARLKVWATTNNLTNIKPSYIGHIYWNTFEWGLQK